MSVIVVVAVAGIAYGLLANIALIAFAIRSERRHWHTTQWMRAQERINRTIAQRLGIVFPPDADLGWEPLNGAVPNVHDLIERDRRSA
jgi:hypothetical protein